MLLLVGLLVGGCGVNIQTGPPTVEEATRANETRGSDIRSQWKTRFEQASPAQKGMLFKTFVDSVTASYFRYGDRIADEWAKGEEGRGQPIAASEMRDMVDAWTLTEGPVLEAYDDIVDYAWTRFQEEGYYTERTMGLIRQYADQYYEVYNVVFFPNGTRSDYLYELQSARAETERLSQELGAELAQY